MTVDCPECGASGSDPCKLSVIERLDTAILTHEAEARSHAPLRPDIAATRRDLAQLLKDARDTIDARERFKAFVHKRLDQAGIPTHPDGPHSKEGCRIGDRLDLALDVRSPAMMDALQSARTALRAQNEWHKAYDDVGGYPDSELEETTQNALREIDLAIGPESEATA